MRSAFAIYTASLVTGLIAGPLVAMHLLSRFTTVSALFVGLLPIVIFILLDPFKRRIKAQATRVVLSTGADTKEPLKRVPILVQTGEPQLAKTYLLLCSLWDLINAYGIAVTMTIAVKVLLRLH